MATVIENTDPNLTTASGVAGGTSPTKPSAIRGGKQLRSKKGLRVSISPKANTRHISLSRDGCTRRNRRRSSSHFVNNKLALAGSDTDDEDGDDNDSDIEFTLDGSTAISGAERKGAVDAVTPTKMGNAAVKKGRKPQQRRRRRSSARFLRLSSGSNAGADASMDAESTPKKVDDDITSSEHLGEIYRQAIRMNAENKINAGNSWGLKLIENMDKFITEDGGQNGGELTPRDNAREELRAARRMKSRDETGRVNFTKASCTLDASVKIYSYRVDDVHLSSYRVLANLNRTDTNKKGSAVDTDGDGMGGEEGAGVHKASKKRAGPKGHMETLETNMTNINISKLDSAYDIDPLFHKMSKSFDEGGAKGLLLGNLCVSQSGCRIVFDSNEEDTREVSGAKLDKLENECEKEGGDDAKEEKFDIGPKEAVWHESEIDIANLASKLTSMLAAYGHRTSSSVPFVPQLESLRHDYAVLEEEGFAVDERTAGEGRKRLKLYDAPEEEEKEAERSIHVIAMERSRGSVLGMSFDTNFRLSMGDLGDHDDVDGDFGSEDFGGEGEFAPTADGDGFGSDGEFEPHFGTSDDRGFDARYDSQPGNFIDARSYNNTKVLLDALCSGDVFHDPAGRNNDYAFFDMKSFERATDGNLWAGSQHWKKRPVLAKRDKKAGERKKVMFDDDGEENENKKDRKRAVKKQCVFIDFRVVPEVDAIFEKTNMRAKKSRKDPYQMPKTEKDFLLPPDAGVGISQLTRLFSRPNAVVRRGNGDDERPISKTVGFCDVGDNALGFDDQDEGDFGSNNDDGFTFAYCEGDQAGGIHDDVDYNIDNFEKVRKVEKIDIAYAMVAKKVDVRRLKKDLWAELEEKTAWVAPESFPDGQDEAADGEKRDDAFVEISKGKPQFVSFKETVEKMEMGQSQSDVTVSFYFICCLHLANEKGLKLDSTGLGDFIISLDDGSAPEFGTFGNGFTETTNKLSGSIANSRGRRGKVTTSYAEEGNEEEDIDGEEEYQE